MEYSKLSNLKIKKIYSLILTVVSITAGIISGFWLGIFIGMIITGYIMNWFGLDTSGEASMAVAGYGFLLGAPIGIIAGAIFSFKKRYSKKWFILIAIIAMFFVLRPFFSVLFSPLGIVMNLIN